MKADVINDESVRPVLEEVAKETSLNYPQPLTSEQQDALTCFFITMCKITTNIFDWLPSEERGQILTDCGTWFSLGMLFGRSPELLVKILDKVNPGIHEEEIPEWLDTLLKR